MKMMGFNLFAVILIPILVQGTTAAFFIPNQPGLYAENSNREIGKLSYDAIPVQDVTVSVIPNAFGSKVLNGDWDLGKQLCSFKSPPKIEYWDVGSIAGEFDIDDVAYIHMNPNSNITEINDIRLTKYGRHNPGSKISANDNDIQKNLKEFPRYKIVFVDQFGDSGYDLQDPVYFCINSASLQIGRMDIRLSSFGNKPAGTLVDGIDPDRGLSATEIKSTFRFLNLNGNMRSDGTAIYDDSDAIYLDVSDEELIYRFAVVNDIRLSG
jgi:hypothetical protein